tara:strand:- start:103 stop:576 length:474 start_codon:yes stop_codon:yes gene_type:complete
MTNHYQTLGIKRNAETKEIKKAFKKLALKFHPDKNNGDKYFEERFKEIQQAYETLIHPQKKIEYDRNFDFFYIRQMENRSQSQSKNKNTNTSYSNQKEAERKQEEKKKENEEKSRVSNIKKNTELAFEDKAWIFIANFTVIGSIIGLFMFIKYRTEG